MSAALATAAAVPVVVPAAVGAAPAPIEHVVRFGASGELFGIFTEPIAAERRARPCLVFINAGLVHRVGPNRLHVKLARRLAARGFASIRFDLSGIGDSQHRSDGVPADEAAVQDACRVMLAAETGLGLGPFILVGLCSGAVTAFRAAVRDPRVVGAVLMNPQGFSADRTWNAEVVARTQARSYRRALFRPDSWRRALSGRIDYLRLLGLLRMRLPGRRRGAAVASIGRQLAADFAALDARGVRTIVICSAGDTSVEYMSAILGRGARADVDDARLTLKMFPRSDHSLTLRSSQAALFEVLDAWAERFGR
ncbi:MAG: alpha/beta fold hydrolase [Acidobacteria bacterium]|nr:alpha/beta fold hydrolase [Acidobacteriota bacterium]